MIKRTITTKPRADGSELVSIRWTFLGIPFFWICFSLDRPDLEIRHTHLGSRKVVMTGRGDPIKVAELDAWLDRPMPAGVGIQEIAARISEVYGLSSADSFTYPPMEVPVFTGRMKEYVSFKWTGEGWARWAAIMGTHHRNSDAFKALSAGASTKYATVSLDRAVWAVVLDIVGNNKNGQRHAVEAVCFGLQA